MIPGIGQKYKSNFDWEVADGEYKPELIPMIFAFSCKITLPVLG